MPAGFSAGFFRIMRFKNNKFFGPFICVLAALIWGLSFVAQKSGAHIGTFTFNGIRTVLGAVVLMPFAITKLVKYKKTPTTGGESPDFDLKTNIIGGIVCGIVLCVASNLQQHAFIYDIQAGKVGFITALYMILVPLLGLLFGRKIKPNIIVAVILGVAGLYLLCMTKGDYKIGKGELFSLACAFGFAVHILSVDYFCNKTDSVILSCVQFTVAGIISVICMFIFEQPVIADIKSCAVQILYAGVCSTGIAFTLQIIGQKYTEPAVASLLMCLESVFSVIFGWLILHDSFSARAIIGCIVMFAGVVLTQINFKSGVKNE